MFTSTKWLKTICVIKFLLQGKKEFYCLLFISLKIKVLTLIFNEINNKHNDYKNPALHYLQMIVYQENAWNKCLEIC